MRSETIGNATLYLGDCIETMRRLPAGSVQTCVTSPPYFGLRDYGHDGQIGLEPTPDEFVSALVAVFREVRRLLADDGTLWLNVGDSYASGGRTTRDTDDKLPRRGMGVRPADGAKPKDLLGIPWRVAFALQQPYYTGRVADERDRVWLAAMVDAEGSICGTEYQTGERIKTNLFISITNTSTAIIEKCDRLFPQEVKHIYEKVNGASNRKCFRWDVERMDKKAMFLREIYPYLVAKRKQAVIGYTFIEMQRGLVSKKKGYLAEQHEQRSWLMNALSRLNSGEDVDLPGWCVEPPSLFEPGFYLRQDVIWHKPNPMPESVRDRCTKAHEYIFLLSKSPRYYFDHEAIKEPAVHAGRVPGNKVPTATRDASVETGAEGHGFFAAQQRPVADLRNRRSVWTVTTKPFKGAHFATFPPDLIEPCILAGCPEGGTVLDPFGGAGTTGLVATQAGRDAVLCEINPEYVEMARTRIDAASLDACRRIEDAQRQGRLIA